MPSRLIKFACRRRGAYSEEIMLKPLVQENILDIVQKRTKSRANRASKDLALKVIQVVR